MTIHLELGDIYQGDEDKRCSNFHYYEISARLSSRGRNVRNSSRHRLLYRLWRQGVVKYDNSNKVKWTFYLFDFKKIFHHYYRIVQHSWGRSLGHHRPASPRWRRNLRDSHLAIKRLTNTTRIVGRRGRFTQARMVVGEDRAGEESPAVRVRLEPGLT